MLFALLLDILQEVCETLKPIEEATREISSEKHLTSSMAIPVASIWKGKMENLNSKHKVGKALKRSILLEHKKLFGHN